MTTLADVEKAADALPAEQKWELLGFLKSRLVGENEPIPEPRRFSREQIQAWIDEDEEDMRRLREEWAAAEREGKDG